MKFNYTKERNVQIVLYLLKKYGIKKVIASPGTTNITLIGSMQQDPFFEIYSSVDERSAAYLACGIAAETGEAVVLSCTGATASRNYMSGLTEAYYRKLPILAITSSQATSRIGQLNPQVIDRSSVANDIVVKSFLIDTIHNRDDENTCEIKVNSALQILRSTSNCGPVHLNLVTTYNRDFSQIVLPAARYINKIYTNGIFPKIPIGKIGIFIGSHKKWSISEENIIDTFCSKYNAVAFCDQTSNYKGKYRFLSSLVACQPKHDNEIFNLDLLIHIGEISGDSYTTNALSPKEVWRIEPNGDIKDLFRKITSVFAMDETDFFSHYIDKEDKLTTNDFISLCNKKYDTIYNSIPNLPFSNIWVAKETSKILPDNSILHLGILNSLRSWNFFEIPNTVMSYSNVGGFGIDGGISTLIGASLTNANKIFFGVFGDLAFFYDMNVLGNHHIGNNIRIMLINNGRGTEFRNYNHMGAMFGEDADKFIAAAGHFGNKSPRLVKHYAEDLGFEYLFADNKENFKEQILKFTSPQQTNKPIIFEIFTDTQDESHSLEIITNLLQDCNVKKEMKHMIKNIIGENNIKNLKSLIK